MNKEAKQLDQAVCLDDIDIMEERIKIGACLNYVEYKPLYILAWLEMIKLLKENGAYIDAQNVTGRTALMTAIFSKKLDIIVQYLFEDKANVGIADALGNTALMIAKESGDKKLIKLLEKSDINSEPFYKPHRHINLKESYGMISYNENLLAKVWKEEGQTKANLQEMVRERFWEKLSYRFNYYEPKIFNEKIALECELTPFNYKRSEGREVKLLALSAGGLDFFPKLCAYQVLAGGTIDPNSSFFGDGNDRDFFEGVVSKEVIKKMNAIFKR